MSCHAAIFFPAHEALMVVFFFTDLYAVFDFFKDFSKNPTRPDPTRPSPARVFGKQGWGLPRGPPLVAQKWGPATVRDGRF